MADLLIELFSEEIPARMQAKAAKDLQKMVTDGLVEAGLTYAGAAAFATPRRLTLSLEGLTPESKPQREDRKGPSTSAPDQALDGFLRSTGLTKDQLEIRDVKKGQVYFAVIEKPGRQAADIIAEVLEATIRNFPWPKSMRWGEGALKWVRPLHSILCILSDETGASVVPFAVDGIAAGNTTRGHRFMAPDAFSVVHFDDYEAKLKRAKVILRAEERADVIWHDATNQAFAQGLDVVEDRGLLAEVANLVEWPVVLMGTIADDFLDMPPEVLQTSMKDHQKFFSVRNAKTNRIERFVTVANIETADYGATILAGNQKVLFARLSDAKFFWENDLRVAKAGMTEWTEGLKAVTFHNKLGSQADRVTRIVLGALSIARDIAPGIGADPDEAAEAAQFAKSDLQSEMIYEFPELQGLMGRYYSKAAGKSDAIAAAAQEHYAPLGPSDDVPTAPVSVCVALADKLDTLTGFWSIDEKPTGSKDPFALRRAALGVIRLVLENEIRIKIYSPLMAKIAGHLGYDAGSLKVANELIDRFNHDASDIDGNVEAINSLPERYRTLISNDWNNRATHLKELLENSGITLRLAELKATDLLSFFHDRLKVFLKDQGIRTDIIDACIAMPGNDDLTLLVKRAKALSETLQTDDGENLLQGFKRANNILTQAEEKDGVEYSYGADLKYAEDDSEKALFAALDAAEAKITPAMQAEDFGTAMTAMAGLRGPIDDFFTNVQVNADVSLVRRNRLNLLSRIRTICRSVADLTLIQG